MLPVTVDSPKTKAGMKQRKKRSLDSIVQILSEKVDMTLLNAARNSQPDKVNSEEEFSKIVSNAFIKHLLNLRGNDSEFVVLLKDIFGDELHDKEFFAWLSKKLDFKSRSDLTRKIMCWEENE